MKRRYPPRLPPRRLVRAAQALFAPSRTTSEPLPADEDRMPNKRATEAVETPKTQKRPSCGGGGGKTRQRPSQGN